MPLRESEAIVLRSYPLGEGDKLVSFFSRSHGRMRGVARGARRPKNRFGATLEPLSHVRIWFFERETRELVRINQCELVESFFDTQRNYVAGVALSMLSEITEAAIPEREPNDAAFRLLLLATASMRDAARVPLSLAYFSLWTLRIGGWLPQLDRCVKCRRVLGEEDVFASIHRPGFACIGCRRPGMSTISSESLVAARRMMEVRLDRLDIRNFPDTICAKLIDHTLNLIEHHIERKLVSRRMMGSKV